MKRKSKYNWLQITLFLLAVVGVGMAASVTIKMMIGVGAWDAICQSLYFMTGIEIGTIGIGLNVILLLAQIALLRKNFRPINLLQIPLSLLLGVVVNWTLYSLLTDFFIDNYLLQLLIFTLAIATMAFCVSLIVILDVVPFPAEGICLAISTVTKWPFARVRQGFDVLCIISSLILTLIFSLTFTIREGTIIGMLILGPLLGFFIPRLEKLLEAHGIIQGKSKLEEEYEDMEGSMIL
ncbi:hypothetical protein [Culicoidibacter larvae]|uniref:YitT family protein n=1 Tax=Culicoidibacter larvae TaxID=2579976 RepID=A0A5R8Q8V5_9FIRM|nr:hypothetical protein [Culicoidibacter larvae]TLG71234.1 hypothetical protein FEZ08_11305 [Culicoidibacter larvae]